MSGQDGLWVGKAADKVIAEFPNQELYTCAAGISPSGVVHFGNFRDVATAYAVMKELIARGKKARLLFSWDNYDRFRKVPAGVDVSFSKYVGVPLSAIPDPLGKYPSYAKRYETEFEKSMQELGIVMDYKYQTDEYTSGRYADKMAFVLANRKKAADIQLQFKTEKANHEKGIDPEEFRETYFPLTVYSRFTGSDKTQVLSYDGGTKVTYRCLVTDKTEQIDFKETPVVKLPWKFDWPMRWAEEGVHFEPGGKDHATPGGSYTVSSVIARELFNEKPPVFQGYEFVGIQGVKGGKMSGSKGGAVSPAMLLEIYEPALLMWLYMRRAPNQSFNLAFDTEVYRQYDEFDREIAAYQQGNASPAKEKILLFSGIDKNDKSPVSFKQAVALGQITQWNVDKVEELAQKSGIPYSRDSALRRLPKAKSWLNTYNPEEKIELLPEKNSSYIKTLSEEQKEHVAKLRTSLSGDIDSIAALDEIVYGIVKKPDMTDKEMKAAQRNFFKTVYSLLIGKETGPRLSTFLWAIDRNKALELLG